MTTRRGFMQAMLALGAAPMIVRADTLMALVQVRSQSFRSAVFGFQRETVASWANIEGLWTYSAWVKPEGSELWERKTMTVRAGVEVGLRPTGDLVAIGGSPIVETHSRGPREIIPHQADKYSVVGPRDGWIAPQSEGGIKLMGAGLEVSLATPIRRGGYVMPLVDFSKGIP